MLGLNLSLGLGSLDWRTLQQRALAAVKRAGGTVFLSGLPRNYFDSAGTTAVTVDNPVGLVLDAAGTVGPELITASWTSSGTGVSEAGGVITFASSPLTDNCTNAGTVTSGKTYEFVFSVSGFSGNGISFMHGGNSIGAIIAANGVHRQILAATSSGQVGVRVRGGTTSAVVSNISVKEITGNHATQATTGSKPTLRRGLVNQLLWSGDFSNAAWVKQQLTVATNATPAPDGGTCFKLTEDTATALHRIEQNWTATAGATYTIAVVVKAAERTWARLFEDSGGGSAWVNLADGALGSVANGAAASTHLGNGWHLLVLTYAQTGTTLRFRLNTATANNIGSYAGDGTSGILLHRAALYQGTVTAQQILDAGGIPLTTTAPASSALGKYWWQFDPSAPGDFFQTAITTGNEGWVCAGVTFGGSATSVETVMSSGANASTIKGVWLARVGSVAENTLWLATGNGTTRNIAAKTDVALRNTPRVIDGGWTATTCFVAVDGVESSIARSGDMTPPAASLQIGAVSGSALLSGSMPVQVICPTLPPPADRALIRRWVGSEQGQTL